MNALKRLRTRMDPRRSNGGVFLGLNGIVVKSHGSSDATGVAAAVDMAYKLARSGFRERLAARVASAVVTGQGASEGAHLPAQDAGMGQPE
jgi:glycerol-3-phosphate acyltransferase PlsX